jgi:hypothetical protein
MPADPGQVLASCLTCGVHLPPSLSYTLRRLGLFVGVLGLASVTLRGVDPIVVLMVATLVSGVLSYVLLAGPREQMARSVAGRFTRLGSRIDAGAAKEDAALDAAETVRSKREKPAR